MALPSLTNLTINGHADPADSNDSDSDIDNAQLEHDLRLINRLEKQKDRLILHNEYERRKQKRRVKEAREKDAPFGITNSFMASWCRKKI